MLSLILIIALWIGFSLLEGWIFMLLANWVLSLFGIGFTFTLKQALGVVIMLDFIGGFFKKCSSYKK